MKAVIKLQNEKMRVHIDVKLEQKDASSHRTVDFDVVGKYTELSISAGTWIRNHGRWYEDSFGQCIDTVIEYAKLEGSARVELLARLCEIWKRWHLNGMRAGSRTQYEAVQKMDLSKSTDWYKDVCETLAAQGLLIERIPEGKDFRGKGVYTFGHGWLVELLPREVIADVKAIVLALGGEVESE